MLTALVSAIVGLVSGAVPKVLEEIRDTRSHQREIEFLKLQNELQIKREEANAEARMREADASIAAEEMRAMREQVVAIIEQQGRPSGNRYIDGLNAILRPIVAAGIIAFFFWASWEYTIGVMGQYNAGQINVEQLNTALWGSLVGEGIQAVFGFLFGYRSSSKMINR